MEKLYKETFDKITAKDDAVYDVLQKIPAETTRKHRRRTGKRVLITALSLVLIFSVISMAGEPLKYGAYIHDVSYASIKAKGFDLPKTLGEYTATDFTRMDTVSSDADAGFDQDKQIVLKLMHLTSAERASYQWYGIGYSVGDRYVWKQEGGARWNEDNPDYKEISVYFGKTDNELWKYTFGFNEDGTFDLDEYIKKYEKMYPDQKGRRKCFDFEKEMYKGITLYEYTEETVHAWSMKSSEVEKSVEEIRNVEIIQWVDEKNGIVYNAYFGTLPREVASGYAKEIIDRMNP